MFNRFQKSSSGFIGLLIIIAIIFSSKYATEASTIQPDHEILLAALEQAGVEAKQFVFQQSGLIHRHQSYEEFVALAEESKEVFEIELSLDDPSQNDMIRYEGRRHLSDHTELQIAWVGKKEQGDLSRPQYAVYLVIEISSSHQDEWKSHYSYLHSGLTRLGIQPQINSSIQGAVGSAMTVDQQSEFVYRVLSRLDAKVTEGIKLDNMVSLSGYSSKLRRTIDRSDGKMNLQLATRLAASESTTIVTIGNPIIIMEY
jgi:hypothetical protein